MIRADGSVAWFETRARWLPERCDPGRQVLIVSRDITARLEFEENSADSERLWQDVGSIIREGVIIASPDGTVITGNRRGAELLDVPLHRLPGITLAGRLLGQDPDSPLDTIEDGEILLTQLRAAGEHGMTCAVRMGNSEERPVRARAVMLADTEFSTQQGRVAVILEPAPHARDTNCAPVTPCPATLDELSPRELAVLRLLAAGLDVRAVSNELALSVHTTRYYVRSILRKLQVRTQLQAVVFAMQAGLPGLS
jgi:DNA-binding NarL/FixJ family response regulator